MAATGDRANPAGLSPALQTRRSGNGSRRRWTGMRGSRPPRQERRPRWKPRPWRRRFAIVVLSLPGLVALALTVLAVIAIIDRGGGGTLGLDRRCDKAAFSCGVLASLLISVVPIAAAVLTLLLWRLSYIRRTYRKRARSEPERLVQTTVADDVVGRQGLCDVLQANIQDRGHRRPQLLVGGVGVGKTAALVRLTRLLAIRHAVPIAIRLRDAQTELDFLALARARFLSEMEPELLSAAEGDKIWRKLLDEERIVVLADGLEEALMIGEAERSRDTAIQLAFAAAGKLPLVVTSRPHDAMRYVDATMLRLEPLSEAAALDYIHSARPDKDGRVQEIVETAEVVEAPLYMQLTRDLHRCGRLPGRGGRLEGRLALRVALLDAWRRAMVEGELFPGVPHTALERESALADLEALACVGLAADSLEVRLDDLRERTPSPQPTEGRVDFHALLAREGSDTRFAAVAGARLDIVDAKTAGVRFRHSIVQAYLGSRRLQALLDSRSDYLDKALADPGREALMALVMFCCRDEGASHRRIVRDRLLEGPEKHNDTKAIDMLAAAVEIDSMIGEPIGTWLDGCCARVWTQSHDQDTEQAKLRAVARVGERARAVGRSDSAPAEPQLPSGRAASRGVPPKSGFLTLWNLCVREESYSVRLAAAQELGAGGSEAFEALRPISHRALRDARDQWARNTKVLAPEVQRKLALQGWILPLLASSVRGTDADRVKDLVSEWIEALRAVDGFYSVEASWAQGFKYESNIRARGADPATRGFLSEQAKLLADSAQFWFSRICLLHAFTLWSLSETGPEDRARERAGRIDDPPDRPPGRARRADLRRTVDGWHVDRGHPLVDEAARLCELALESDEPAKYVWIDEAGVVAKLGPKVAGPSHVGNSRLWIAPAAGWLALDTRASRLVAEIVVLLNLAEGTDRAASEQRLSDLGDRLPRCITGRGERGNLQIAGVEDSSQRRARPVCETCENCLCPYLAPGHQPFRGELSEAFCREQLRNVSRFARSRAPWQHEQRPRELKDFWRDMERRARL